MAKLQTKREGAALSASSGATAQPSCLFSLPQELQDAIFNDVYAPESVVHIRFNSRYSPYRNRFDPQGLMRSKNFPHKVSEWIVSKQYFMAAARAWFSNQMLKKPLAESVGYVRLLRKSIWFRGGTCSLTSSSDLFLRGCFGLFFQFCKRAEVELTKRSISPHLGHPCAWLHLLGSINRCHALETPVVKLDESSFQPHHLEVKTRPLPDELLQKVLDKTGLTKLLGLKQVEFQLHDKYYPIYSNPALRANVDRLNVLASSMKFTARKSWRMDIWTTPEDLEALYVGSRVRLRSSKQQEIHEDMTGIGGATGSQSVLLPARPSSTDAVLNPWRWPVEGQAVKHPIDLVEEHASGETTRSFKALKYEDSCRGDSSS